MPYADEADAASNLEPGTRLPKLHPECNAANQPGCLLHAAKTMFYGQQLAGQATN